MEKVMGQVKSDVPRDLTACRQYWEEQVRQWRVSGFTQKEYCGKGEISLERFGTWKRRFDREGQSQTGNLVAIPSRIVTSALHVSPLKLVVKERYRLEIPDAFSPATLETVIHILNRL